MAKRSLKASEAGQLQAKKAFERTGWTQEQLAFQVGLGTRQSVWKFFTGRPVDRSIFIDLCFQLDLEWEAIVDTPIVKAKVKPPQSSNLRPLKAELRDTLKAPLTLTTMPFDIGQPLPLPNIYTPQFFLPTISSQRWLELHELSPTHRSQQRIGPSNHDAAQFAQNTKKLVILGNPGSGKTTFLQHIALQCLEDRLYPDSIPIFITLRSFVAQYPSPKFPTLEQYIGDRLSASAGKNLPIAELLKAGKFLLLFDGLDEVDAEAIAPLCRTIQTWSQTYGNNRFILTCRTAAQQYLFQGFTHQELAEFTPEQIEQFVQQFFQAVSPRAGTQKAKDFLEQLYRKPNQPIRNLVTTPILLNLVCSIFQARKTLPTNRAKLYQAALEILMERWDNARGINRNPTESLSLSKVERLKLLSHLAAQTFEKGKLFFDKQDLLHIILDYWQTHSPELPDQAPCDTEKLWAKGELTIRTIAAHDGLLVERAKDIYSFSHLTFHEYLTARNIVAAPTPQLLTTRLQNLAANVSQYRWREVIFLTVNLLPEPLAFLEILQQAILQIIIDRPKIHHFLSMIEAKTDQLNLAYPQWALRIFYFSALVNADLKLSFNLESLFANQLAPALSLDLMLLRLLKIMAQVKEKASMSHILMLYSALNFETQYPLTPEFQADIQTLKAELPTELNGQQNQQDWWQTDGRDWMNRWSELIHQHRGLSLDWQWSPEDASALQTYYQANQLLVDCLQFEARLTVPEREAIMAQLLVSPSKDPLIKTVA